MVTLIYWTCLPAGQGCLLLVSLGILWQALNIITNVFLNTIFDIWPKGSLMHHIVLIIIIANRGTLLLTWPISKIVMAISRSTCRKRSLLLDFKWLNIQDTWFERHFFLVLIILQQVFLLYTILIIFEIAAVNLRVKILEHLLLGVVSFVESRCCCGNASLSLSKDLGLFGKWRNLPLYFVVRITFWSVLSILGNCILSILKYLWHALVPATALQKPGVLISWPFLLLWEHLEGRVINYTNERKIVIKCGSLASRCRHRVRLLNDLLLLSRLLVIADTFQELFLLYRDSWGIFKLSLSCANSTPATSLARWKDIRLSITSWSS